MKIYVDELPKKCKDCRFSEIGYAYDNEVRFCKLQERCMNWINLYTDKYRICPLQLISDHDKEVRADERKKVLEQILEWIDWEEKSLNLDKGFDIGYNGALSNLCGILKQIQGETNDSLGN